MPPARIGSRPGSVRLGDRRLGVRRPLRRRAGVGAVAIAVEPVRGPRLVRRARSGRNEAEVAIDLGAVGVDHGAARSFRQRERERRLAARGRPRDKRQRGFASGSRVHRDLDSSGSADARRYFRRRGRAGRHARAIAGWRRGAPAISCSSGRRAHARRSRGLIPGVDVIVQPAASRRKRLLVADMDSTMITVECIDELADYAGRKAEVAAVTERAMRGELAFEEALDARVALLKDLDEAMIERCHEERVRVTPGAQAAGANDARPGRPLPARLGRLQPVRRPRGGRHRLRRRPVEPARHRRGQAGGNGRAPGGRR